MSRASAARRIATTAAYGGGSLVGVGAASAGLLFAQAAMARRTIGIRKASALYSDGYYGPRRPGTSLRLAVLGDSSAAGFGANSPLETPAALLAQGLVDAADRPVRLINFSSIGARSNDLDEQVTRALQVHPHAAVIMIGGNDVTHFVRPQTAVRALEQAVSRLAERGTGVIVGTCPDIGTVKPIPQPLRYLARHLSRQMAAAQTIAIVEAGGRSVSLADLLGPEFEAYPDEMFAADGFHPSSAGYAAAAQVLLPSLLDSLGLLAPEERLPDVRVGDAVLPVAIAAVEAADTVGTEVAAARVRGEDRGPKGRWVQLRHRVLHPVPVAQRPAPLDADIPEEPDT